MKKGLIYARQSSGTEDVSASVENQIENCKSLAEKENIEIIGVFQDLNTSGKTYPVGGESVAENDSAFQKWYKNQTGTKKYRNGLGDALKLIEKVDYIIVDDMTRLYRPFRGSYLENYINNILTENAVQVLQVKGGKIDLSKFDQNLITMLKNAINDEQIANQKMKSMQQLRRRKDSGFLSNGGGKAFGTVYNPADGSIEIKPEFIPAIQYIFNEAEKFTPYLKIIENLNKSFIHLVPKCFYYSNFYHVVMNPIYCGYMLNSEGFLIKNQQLKNPCISFEQWSKVKNLVQSKKGKNARAKKNWLPFSGLLYCGNCGGKLSCGTDKGRIFYNCFSGSNYLKDEACKKSRIYVEHLFTAVKPLLVMALIEKINADKKRKTAKDEIDKVQAEIENLKLKQKNIMNLYLKGLISTEEMETVLSDLKNQLQALNEKLIASSFQEDETTKHLLNVDKKFSVEKFMEGDFTDAEFEVLLKSVVKRIEVFEKSFRINTVQGMVEIPRINKKSPVGKVIINGRENLSAVVTYQTGVKSEVARFDNIQIKTA